MSKKMNNSEIMQLLKEYKERVASRYDISSLGLFGSFAKGEATVKSDIDVVIELQDPDMLKPVHIKEELEELFGVRVDIVRRHNKMNPYLKKHIEKEALYV